MGSKKIEKKSENGSFQTWEKDKNFLIIDDRMMKYFRDLKDRIKEETGLRFTYNMILVHLLECVDNNKFNLKLKSMAEVLKGGQKNE